LLIYFVAAQLNMSVRELLNTMTVTEFAGWMAYFKVKREK
tara:strand:+ start:1017 stop:1136 length:120 start_codon:yes stop_codon:yes gene_type:complete